MSEVELCVLIFVPELLQELVVVGEAVRVYCQKQYDELIFTLARGEINLVKTIVNCLSLLRWESDELPFCRTNELSQALVTYCCL